MRTSVAGGRRRSPYAGCSALTGAMTQPQGAPTVAFRRVTRGRDRVVITILGCTSVLTGLALVVRLLTADVTPADGPAWWPRAPAVLVACIEVSRLLQVGNLAWFATAAVDPVPMTPQAGLRVALLTTIVPDREPLTVVAETLRAMRRVRHAEHVDVWLLDEGADATVRRTAQALGVHYFTRNGRPDYNMPSGPFRTRTKAGNHNAWRAEHEGAYDVVAQMDPDHVPLPCFLERTLGYFRDPDVAYVVAPQVYGNLYDGFVQHAAAAQSFVFTGVIQRGGNGLGAPLLIGTNHLYRTRAWATIGGYQDSIIEDHLTGLTVTGTLNPATGKAWRGVYTPDVIAVGEGPTSWTDFFKQQRRWSYGVADIVLHHSPRLIPKLAPRQRLAYLLLQSFYPSCATAWGFGNVTTGLYLALHCPQPRWPLAWALLWVCSLAAGLSLFIWLRRYNLAPHERAELGILGMFASLVSGPVYVMATISALFRQPLGYAVTPKGSLASRDVITTFRLHLTWAAVIGAVLSTGGWVEQHEPVRLAWALLSASVCCSLPSALLVSRARKIARGWKRVRGAVDGRPEPRTCHSHRGSNQQPRRLGHAKRRPPGPPSAWAGSAPAARIACRHSGPPR